MNLKAITRRKHQRLPVNFEVEISHISFGVQILRTRNISDGGVFLVTETPPAIGELVMVRLRGFLGDGDEPPQLSMRVVRIETLGCGLEFCDECEVL
ncbi:MAG: PilZ domain-containing protein [Gammaproteobacteria bacterium]|nr:PilZ domain-containing protein [Gammaproteobacteria bacterium]